MTASALLSGSHKARLSIPSVPTFPSRPFRGLKGTRVRFTILSALTLSSIVLAGCHSGGSSISATALGVIATPREPAGTSTSAEFNAGLAERLTVLTFNMKHRNNPNELSIMANRLGRDFAETPDFILCQEVLFNRKRSYGRDETNTAEILANDLDYHVRATKRSSDPEGVAIVSRYPFEYYAERELDSQTSKFLLGFKRVSVMGEFMVPSVGRVRVVNVHLTNWGFEKRVRTNQLRETMEWMAQREAAVHADVTIFGGDFNSDPNGDEIKVVTEGTLARKFNFRDFNTDDPTRGGKGKPNDRVDYIFISSPRREVRFAGPGERRLWMEGLSAGAGQPVFHLSDHVPVMHEYGFSGPVVASAHSRANASVRTHVIGAAR